MKNSIYSSLSLTLYFIFFSPCFFSFSLETPSNEITAKKIGFFTILGNKADLSVILTDSTGKTAPLKDSLSPNIPTIILPVYYGCPRLCGLTLTGFTELVKSLSLSLGKEYQVATISIDPDESSELAHDKSNTVFAQIERKDFNKSSWHFFVGGESSEEKIRSFMDKIGFRYEKDGAEYAHSSGFIILTPDGEISQYFTGIEFSSWNVRLALIEASKGKIGSAIDHLLLFCFRFDPIKGRYTWIAFNTVRIGVFVSILLFAMIVYLYSRRAREEVLNYKA